MGEQELILYCSPTLASLKTGSLFSVRDEEPETLRGQIRRMNRMLAGSGVTVMALKLEKKHSLIYVFRAEQLARDLADPETVQILESKGYPQGEAACLLTLIRRLGEGGEFPHEIGLFLGYPPKDVRGFIEHPGGGIAGGPYRVFGDLKAARKTFDRYEKCNRIYRKAFEEGRSLTQLAVPGGRGRSGCR